MSFYITLPSNSSMRYFPNNTLTKYTTKLHNQLQLEGKYEVALTEIIFPFNWLPTITGNIEIMNKNVTPNKIIVVRLDQKRFQTIPDLFDSINTEIKSQSFTVEFNYNEKTNKVVLRNPNNEQVRFSKHLNKIFGFNVFLIQTSYEGNFAIPKNINDVNSLYIYSDIIEYQYVGDTYAPLLRVIAVENNLHFGDNVDVIYNSPHYVPLMRNLLDTIEIDIRNDSGDPIYFNGGKVMIKLHFRPKISY